MLGSKLLAPTLPNDLHKRTIPLSVSNPSAALASPGACRASAPLVLQDRRSDTVSLYWVVLQNQWGATAVAKVVQLENSFNR